MDAGPLKDYTRAPTWKLAPRIAELTQGIVVTGFGRFPTGRALFLEFGGSLSGGRWLAALEEVAPVTSARPPDPPEHDTLAVAVALTHEGLRRMGLPETALASFDRPFREGMFQVDRLRRLGDRRRGVWQETVIKDGPVWSANTPAAGHSTAVRAYDVARPDGDESVATPITVHAMVLLYARDERGATQLADQVATALQPHDVAVVRTLDLFLDIEGGGISREHFGFADGLSQPDPYDEDGAVNRAGRDVRAPANRVQGVPLGEFLIGYLNGHHERSPGPVVPSGKGMAVDPDLEATGLVPHSQAMGFYDFGLNGSYLVVRELRQDVVTFWRSLERIAAEMRDGDPTGSGHVTAEWLAERIVARDRDGHLLCPGNTRLPPTAYGPDNDFQFYESDPHGEGCPPGSHVRRAHPRDALAPTPKDGPTLLDAANNHRILRRGRKFGPKIADPSQDDGVERGLLFMCLNTDIARQFEFIQQTWLLNSDFATLFEEVDPLIGPDGRMTIREPGLRRSVHVETFVEMVGGDYFFLPSLPALRHLARL